MSAEVQERIDEALQEGQYTYDPGQMFEDVRTLNALLEHLRRAVMEEWGFDWKHESAVIRILGRDTYARLREQMGSEVA